MATDAAAAAGLFAIRVDRDATHLAITPRGRYDLETITIDLPAGHLDGVDVLLPAARGAIKGRVVDEQGEGVEGIRVRLNGSYADDTTVDSGFFSFRPLRDDTYSVGVADVPFAAGESPTRAVEVEDAAQRGTLVFVVERGATLLGEVSDAANGSPIEGARIVLTRQGGRDHRTTASDGDGDFLLPRLVGGSFQLAVTADGYGRAQLPIDGLGLGEQRHVAVTMSASAGELSGRILDEEGKPLPFATVTAEAVRPGGDRQRISARADSRGHFRLASVASGVWEVFADPGWCEIRNWIPGDAVVVQVQPGGKSSADVKLRRGRYVRGRVRSASDRKDIQVRLTRDGGESIIKTMGKQGHFAFGGLPSSLYVLEALDPARPDAPPLARTQVFVGTAEDARVSLQVP